MGEFIKSLNLGTWGMLLLGAYLVWRFILKDAFEICLKSDFEYKNQNNLESLKSQRELILKQLEFERVKLERLLPAIEQINESIQLYRLMQANYSLLIANRSPLPTDFEAKRVEIDEKILSSISKITIYVKPEFRELLYQLRKIISCSWQDPKSVNVALKESGCLKEALTTYNDMLHDLYNCFFDMCRATFQVSADTDNYNQFLSKYNLNESIEPKNYTPIISIAWKYLLLLEFYDFTEVSDSLDGFKNH